MTIDLCNFNLHDLFNCLASCSPLSNPDNGIITCSLGDDGTPYYEDTCNFTCNTGYELTGSDTRTCQSNGSWSGTDAVCRKGKIILSIICDWIVKKGIMYIYDIATLTSIIHL